MTDGRPTGAIRIDRPGDHPGDRSGELAAGVAVLRERIADKDTVIADLRQRLDAAERSPGTDPVTAIGIQTLSQAVEMLRQDVERERDRADRAERQAEEGRKRIDALLLELADARTAR